MSGMKLEIGLLVDSLVIPAWIYRAIERLANSKYIEIALIILNDRASGDKKSVNPTGVTRIVPIAYQLFDFLDQTFFVRRLNAEARRHLTDLLGKIRTLNADEFLEQASNIGLDVIANFSIRHHDFSSFRVARYGVWEYQFGEDKPIDEKIIGYWETIENRPLTYAGLYSQAVAGQPSRTLYYSNISTYHFSPARNRNAIRWFASSFMARQCELLAQFGEDRFYKEVSRFERAELPRRKQAVFPSNWEVFRGVLRLLGRIVRELWFRLVKKDLWWLQFNFDDHPNYEINQFHKIPPSSDRFWADPFITKEHDRYFIFVEEYEYKRKKGHISVIELDPEGIYKDPAPVLVKNYHLSYPCVIKCDGTYFMVPESATNHTIDLYECEIFPIKWKFRMTLIEGVDAVDTTIFFYGGKWWLFTGIRENNGAYPDVELFLFSAKTLFTNHWKPHPLNPVVSDVTRARPAGNIFLDDGKLYRPSQNCSTIYGSKININEITVLSENDYQEKTTHIIQPDWDQNIVATHTYSHYNGLNVIDAFTRKRRLLW